MKRERGGWVIVTWCASWIYYISGWGISDYAIIIGEVVRSISDVLRNIRHERKKKEKKRKQKT